MESETSQVDLVRQAAETKTLPTDVERKRIVGQLQSITKEIEEIDKNHLHGFQSWFNPSGADGRTWSQEVSYALEHRSEGYTPKMTYPVIERGFLRPNDPKNKILDLESANMAINELNTKASTEYPDITQVAEKLLEKKANEIGLLEAIQNGDHEGAIKHMQDEAPSEGLVKYAKAVHEVSTKPNQPEENDSAKSLKKHKFHPRETKEYFEYALDMIGADGWSVVISQEHTAVTVNSDIQNIFIPHNRFLDGVSLLRLLAHEVGVHAATTDRAVKKGYGSGSIGNEASTLQEGLAKVAERDVEKLLMGHVSQPNPYFVLGINKAIESDGDFWSTYDHVYQIRKDELLSQDKPDVKAVRMARKRAEIVTRRIFRGAIDLNQGGYVYTKDKSYLEGEMVANNLKEEGLLGYMLDGKYDIPTAIFLLETGIIPPEAVDLVVDVSHKIYSREEDKDYLENLDWWRENYHRESDEKYENAWVEYAKTLKQKG